ncbi:MAG: DUF4160 domain-containing protein [Candidatus Methylomirabilota bacterium]|nr:DUF4160 domain-containing protein [candidate division NC10 bacterium]PWB42909.1 MAG: DUF4160 domain-containing protein [candidate division NC10 bacterium]
MPTIFHNLRGYRIFFFSPDRGEPMHVHVAKDRGYAKYWMRPLKLARSRNFRSHELQEIARLIEDNRAEIERRWYAHFGRET